jgi:hypothetical protein
MMVGWGMDAGLRRQRVWLFLELVSRAVCWRRRAIRGEFWVWWFRRETGTVRRRRLVSWLPGLVGRVSLFDLESYLEACLAVYRGACRLSGSGLGMVRGAGSGTAETGRGR